MYGTRLRCVLRRSARYRTAAAQYSTASQGYYTAVFHQLCAGSQNEVLREYYRANVLYLAFFSHCTVVFDKPIRKQFNPKKFEQERRDDTSDSSHTHRSFEPTTKLDIAWQEVIGCRVCKYSLVEAIGLCFMKESSFWLNTNEVIIISGCFSDNIAWKIC